MHGIFFRLTFELGPYLGFLNFKDFGLGLGFENVNSSATFLKAVNSSIIAHCADDESAVLQLLDDDKNKYEHYILS